MLPSRCLHNLKLLKAPVLLGGGRMSSTYAHLKTDLLSRSKLVILEPLSHHKVDLLTTSLADHLPATNTNLPPAFHLTFCVTASPESQLLPDGTEPHQSPGEPFVRRMWAGGSFNFHPERMRQLIPGKTEMACVEGIRDVTIKGKEGEEKVFVGIERRFAPYQTGSLSTKPGEVPDAGAWTDMLWTEDEADFGKDVAVIERRNIVFMREHKQAVPPADGSTGGKGVGKMLKPQHQPDFAHTIQPTARLLFRYSALTFNAHKIHLDPEYCRNVEGHRNLLVHGPLSITFLNTLLHNHLTEKAQAEGNNPKDVTILSLDYRNLAPLYADEPIKLCGKLITSSEKEDKYELWAETPEGGLAVKASAKVRMCGKVDRQVYWTMSKKG